MEQELANANSVIDGLHEQIKHLEEIIATEQKRNKQNSVSKIKMLIFLNLFMYTLILFCVE